MLVPHKVIFGKKGLEWIGMSSLNCICVWRISEITEGTGGIMASRAISGSGSMSDGISSKTTATPTNTEFVGSLMTEFCVILTAPVEQIL